MDPITHGSLLVPLMKLGAVFALMLALIRIKTGLGTSILTGSIILGLVFGMPGRDIMSSAVHALTDAKMLYLNAIVALILILSEAMEKTGQSKRLMNNLTGLLRFKRLKLAFFPALIGLLPMPGGAVFSAPMVKNAASGLSMSGEDKVLVNYWFRHIWELIWPLYPGFLLAAYLADVPLLALVSVTWPSLPLALLFGWIFFLRPKALRLPSSCPSQEEESSADAGTILRQGLPLLIAIAGSLLLEGGLWLVQAPVDYEAGLVIALSASIGCSAVQNRIGLRGLWRTISKKHLVRMIYLLLAIFLFKQILADGGVVAELSGFAQSGTTLVAVCLTLPFLVGLISGITIAFVGSTFPLILGLLSQGGIREGLPFLVLSLFSGYTGVLASPLHVCLLLSCEYFHTPLGVIWKRLVPPALLFLGAGFVYFLLLRHFL